MQPIPPCGAEIALPAVYHRHSALPGSASAPCREPGRLVGTQGTGSRIGASPRHSQCQQVRGQCSEAAGDAPVQKPPALGHLCCSRAALLQFNAGQGARRPPGPSAAQPRAPPPHRRRPQALRPPPLSQALARLLHRALGRRGHEAAMDEFRAQLDALMGEDRNVPLAERDERRCGCWPLLVVRCRHLLWTSAARSCCRSLLVHRCSRVAAPWGCWGCGRALLLLASHLSQAPSCCTLLSPCHRSQEQAQVHGRKRVQVPPVRLLPL